MSEIRCVVTIEAQYVVSVEHFDAALAEASVRERWHIYKHHARWLNNCPPQLQGGRILDVKAIKE